MSTRKRKTARPVNETAIERRVKALKDFSMSNHFEEVMQLLKDNAFWFQVSFDAALSPEVARSFPAAVHNPGAVATYIDGRKSLVNTLEIEIQKAKRWTRPKPNLA